MTSFYQVVYLRPSGKISGIGKECLTIDASISDDAIRDET